MDAGGSAAVAGVESLPRPFAGEKCCNSEAPTVARMTRRMADVQSIRGTRRSHIRVVKQEKDEAETSPGVPSRHRHALAKMSG